MNYENNNNTMSSYAKSAIGGSVLLNSGALIAVLSQLSNLANLVNRDNVEAALTCWTIGVCVGTFAWIFAFASTSAFGHGNTKFEFGYSVAGLLCVLLAIGAFGLGMLNIAWGYQPSSTSTLLSKLAYIPHLLGQLPPAP